MRIFLGALLCAGLLSGNAPSHAQTSKSITVALAHEPDRLYNPTTLAGQLVANLVFGGPKRNRLFICATSSLYSVIVAVNGAKTF